MMNEFSFQVFLSFFSGVPIFLGDLFKKLHHFILKVFEGNHCKASILFFFKLHVLPNHPLPKAHHGGSSRILVILV